MDIGRAVGYVFDDDEWVKKILIGGGLSLVPVLGSLAVYGYMIAVARRVFYAPNTEDLPDWDDFGAYITQGLIFGLGLMLWILPFLLIFLCVFLIPIFFGVAVGEEAVIGLSLIFFYFIFFPVIFVFALLAAFITPILLGRYAIHGRFAALFEFGEIIVDLRRVGAGPLLLLFVTSLAAGYIAQIGYFLCLVGVIFTAFYGNLVIAHAAGQTYRLARGLEPPPPPVQAPKGY